MDEFWQVVIQLKYDLLVILEGSSSKMLLDVQVTISDPPPFFDAHGHNVLKLCRSLKLLPNIPVAKTMHSFWVQSHDKTY